MEKYVFFTSDPVMLLFLTLITALLIFLGRQLEKRIFPATIVVYSLGLLIYHTLELSNAGNMLGEFYFSIAADVILLFLGFISYLWIDSIVAKNKGLKSYSDVLAWFWEKF